ncbi:MULTISPECIES: GNAT family N-acetyltransferase [unclassified Bradyrhizobium]|uniref:GNAT family N-acetyltransferase n=1 Tax=unclassified Bradyrhizobium TaxID=2631580 RepID=UPI001BABC761|nr:MULTISPECIES: GNAT family N-acetyltransferase [unclassified Bradyrhizobium]MBR1224692.1 GNAT family N-acetyltransferase [Bradyrhizobium sp. AUGA SZCCT0176]MBR1299827.1 GNAT family N-acetyltransferase [Bradyrhizobium sp. AUGA SZCCT0042]
MILPDGDFDVPPGKIATVVTHLEMTELPAIPSDPKGAWTLRRAEAPGLDWYRELFRRVGEEWLWISRTRMPDARLAANIHSPLVEVYALEHEGRDEGLLELDFREAGQCELGFFGVTAKLIGSGAGRWMMNRALELSWSRPIERFWVHTCTHDHPSAVAFYQRSGFRAFRRQIEIEDDPRLDGTAPRDAARHVPVIE